MRTPKEKKATSDKDKTRAQLLEEVDLLRQQLADRETAKGHREHSYTHAPVGLCYFDRDMRYLQINDCLAAINGLSVEEHLGKRIQDVLPQGAVGIVHRLRQVIETGAPIIEKSRKRHDPRDQLSCPGLDRL